MGIIEKMRLDGKKGFVTGAARGIGNVQLQHLQRQELMWQL